MSQTNQPHHETRGCRECHEIERHKETCSRFFLSISDAVLPTERAAPVEEPQPPKDVAAQYEDFRYNLITLSQCCSATVATASERECWENRFYICTACWKPCELATAPPPLLLRGEGHAICQRCGDEAVLIDGSWRHTTVHAHAPEIHAVEPPQFAPPESKSGFTEDQRRQLLNALDGTPGLRDPERDFGRMAQATGESLKERHVFDPISKDADECECGLVRDADVHPKCPECGRGMDDAEKGFFCPHCGYYDTPPQGETAQVGDVPETIWIQADAETLKHDTERGFGSYHFAVNPNWPSIEYRRVRVCEWTNESDEYWDVWHSACGETWQFESGGPKENKARYCPFCGGRLETA